MRPDIDGLQHFYDSRQGQIVRRLIVRQLRALWPRLDGQRVLGLGYPTPYLLPLAEGAERVVAMMPAGHGARRWPRHGPSAVALAREDELPLPDRSIDRVLLAHALEGSDHPRRLLREVWRVLADDGRLVVLVPNRHGLWSLSERTPFGHGRPYSRLQLERALRDSLFEPGAAGRAVYMPPSGRRFFLRLAVPLERAGLRLLPHLAGVLLLEAGKRVAAPGLEAARTRNALRGYVPIPARLAPSGRAAREEPYAAGERDLNRS
jgi:SAM-dependent methyltransferase